MSLFSSKVSITQAMIEEKAEILIMERFQTSYYSDHGFGNKGINPSESYARKVLEDAVKNTDVVKAIDSLIGSTIVKDHIERTINLRIDEEVKKALREDLIKEIVTKINELQVKTQ